MDDLKINPKDYTKIFQVGNVPFILSDIFVAEYKKLNIIALFEDTIWSGYVPKESIKESLVEGLKIYSSPEKFNVYKTGFEEYIKKSKEYLDEIVKNDSLNKEELEACLKYMTDFYSFYRKTEYFATDEAYQYSLSDEATAQNLSVLKDVKKEGREYLNKLFFGEQSYLSRMLGIISKQFNIDLQSISSFGIGDLINLFEGKELSVEVMDQRKSSYLMIGDAGGVFYFDAGTKKIEEISGIFNSNISSSSNEIRGTTANKGFARGKAKVIPLNYSDFDNLGKIIDEMAKGDILVAETTSPEFMPACLKASAIVTNTGGMLSHAAIVSRELGIPCIVGATDATELIKTGDMIEADADNGIIRIIK